MLTRLIGVIFSLWACISNHRYKPYIYTIFILKVKLNLEEEIKENLHKWKHVVNLNSQSFSVFIFIYISLQILCHHNQNPTTEYVCLYKSVGNETN